MKIMINGSEKLIDRNILVYDLILQLGIENKRYAIECNGEIIPKSEIKNRTINEGDKFEIVGAVGGG
jgi:sulfur carrier protein